MVFVNRETLLISLYPVIRRWLSMTNIYRQWNPFGSIWRWLLTKLIFIQYWSFVFYELLDFKNNFTASPSVTSGSCSDRDFLRISDAMSAVIWHAPCVRYCANCWRGIYSRLTYNDNALTVHMTILVPYCSCWVWITPNRWKTMLCPDTQFVLGAKVYDVFREMERRFQDYIKLESLIDQTEICQKSVRTKCKPSSTQICAELKPSQSCMTSTSVWKTNPCSATFGEFHSLCCSAHGKYASWDDLHTNWVRDDRCGENHGRHKKSHDT